MRVWVWVGLLWSDRVQLALEHYGDRLTDVSIFGWHVNAQGQVTQDFDPDLLLPYAEKWPHLRFWLAFRNDGSATIAQALLDSPAAQTRLLDGLASALDARPWLAGIDIDLERIGGAQNAVPAENLFRRIANLAHGRGLECSAALPPLTATGSVGGENWARYAVLGEILDHVSIMSYDFAWSGSAPGPVSPGFWMETVYDWAVSQMPPSKVRMGLPLYMYHWYLHDYPDQLGDTYRGNSGSYYAAWQRFTGVRAWDGTDANPGGSGSHHRIGWLGFRDPDSRSAWGFIDVYDWRDPHTWDDGSATGVTKETYEGRPYTVRYGRPSGTPLWSVADNSAPTAGATYTLTPRRVRSAQGELVEPKNGFTLTTELLKRYPVAATIIDDNASTSGQLNDLYDVITGSWSQWSSASGQYHQYRGEGELRFAHDFTGDAIYLQIRGQFTSSGWSGLKVRDIAVDLNAQGEVQLRQGSTVIATANVTARPVGAAAGSGRFVLGLRVRENTARVYFGLSETNEPALVIQASVTPAGGDVGILAAGLWVDHVYLGDGWWYQPREAIEVTIGAQSRVLGRFPRTGITWDASNRFRPIADVDESETRDRGYSLDWVYDHWVGVPLTADDDAAIRIRPLDHDVWLGRVLALDRNGAGIVYWTDAETVAHWADRARFDWGLSGIALWSLGQEDLRTWDRLAGGELSAATKRTNS